MFAFHFNQSLFKSIFFVSLFALLTTTVNGVALARRGVINHDAVIGFPQTVPDTPEGAAYLKYKPWLDVPHGCVPFPAVDVLGNTGGGLSHHDGNHYNRCGRNLGQVYARGTWYKDVFGIMYSWYMPKDSPSPGLGHRHDWENVIVWIDSLDPIAQRILAVSTSYHGNYKKIPFSSGKLSIIADRVLIKYGNNFLGNHHPDITSIKGGEQPLIAWESLSDAARFALEVTNFGSATVPFKNSTLVGNFGKGWFQ